MLGSTLEVSLLATALLEGAAQKKSGSLALGARSIVLVSGAVADVTAAPSDVDLPRFLLESGRISQSTLAEHERAARSEHVALTDALVQHGAVTAAELRHARRAMLLDRVLRAFAEEGLSVPELAAPSLPPQRTAPPRDTLPLVPLVLDALSRLAAGPEGNPIGALLNHRVEWTPSPHQGVASAWADLGELPRRPAVSTVLARRPAAAPRIAALVRAGLLELSPPGHSVSTLPPAPLDLPEPPPRPSLPRLSATAAEAETQSSDTRAMLASMRPPRVRLDPGHAHASTDALEPTPLPVLPKPARTLSDPLDELELHAQALEAAGARGPERARAFRAIAEVWQERYASAERASRALREAASADPQDSEASQLAALHCHFLGERELARRYVESAIATATLPMERSLAQLLRATIERAAGETWSCIEALCEAAADDPGNAQPHERVAALMFELDNADGANAHARLAAAILREDSRERALALLAFARALRPADVATAYEHASLLDESGRKGAAAAVLAETAQRVHHLDHKRKLRLAAAERAESAGQAGLAAELLVQAFDEEPHFDLLYAPMDQDLRSVELAEYRAVALEDVATVCPGEQRAQWLSRAGVALLQLGDQREAALWLFFEALLLDPRNPSALSPLREHAEAPRELALFAHALRIAIAANLDSSPELTIDLLQELTLLCSSRAPNPYMALGAAQQLERLGAIPPAGLVDDLRAQVDELRAEQESVERSLVGAAAEERGTLSLRLARSLPEVPESFARVIGLLCDALGAGVDDPELRKQVELLYGLRRDAAALAVFLEDQADLTANRAERVRLLCRLAAVHAVREDPAAVALACERALDLDPECHIAIARLERVARRLRDARRLGRALELRLRVTRRPRERSRMLAQLASLAESQGDAVAAAAHAHGAIGLHADTADALLVLLRNVHLLPPREALECLVAIERTHGPSRDVLVARAQAAEALSNLPTQRAAIRAWVTLAPSDAEGHGAWLRVCIHHGDDDAVLEAAEDALARVASSEAIELGRAAFECLRERGAHAHAARLALRVLREQGRVDRELALALRELALAGGQPKLATQALELQIAFAPEAERPELLLALAAHHRKSDDAAAELRALLRVLELQEDDAQALARLHDLFARVGDAERSLWTLAAIARSTGDPRRKRAALLESIAIADQRLRDHTRVEANVRSLVALSEGDLVGVREALGALLAVGEPSWALERALAIAADCHPELGCRVYLWCAVTAEQRLHDPRLALDIAHRGALRWPTFAELLLVVERLTLSSEDVALAMSTYDTLIDAAVGPHGKRALHYRAGRWLERAGLPEQALDRYLRAFELSKTAGAAFRALERVARQCRRLDRVVPCYEALAGEVHSARARINLFARAADLCLGELGDPKQGLAYLRKANASSERHELDERVLQAARQVRLLDPEAGNAALRELAAELSARAADAWVAEDKARWLLRLAQLHARELGAHDLAIATANDAITACAGEESCAALAAEAAALRDGLATRLAKPTVRPPPIEVEAEPEAGPEAMIEATVEEPEPQTEPEAVVESVARAEPEAAVESAAQTEVVVETETETEVEAETETETETETRAEPAAETETVIETETEAASSAGAAVEAERDAGAALREPERADVERTVHTKATLPVPEPTKALSSRPASGRDTLRQRILEDPSRVELLRALALSDLEPLPADARAARAIVATFDPNLRAAHEPDAHAGLWRDRSLFEAVGPALPGEVTRLLSALWDVARVIPRFRKPLTSFGLSERDRISRVTVGPVAEAYAHAVRMLGAREIAVYVQLHSAAAPRTLPTHPPCVVTGRGAAQDTSGLLYAMAKALWLARPEHVIAGVLDATEGEELLLAAKLAFAPSRADRPPNSVKEIAAALWQSVPTRDQQRLSDTLRQRPPVYAELRTAVRASAARAALLASANVRTAFESLAASEPELGALDLGQERAFVHACQSCVPFADTVRAALSPAHLRTLELLG